MDTGTVIRDIIFVVVGILFFLLALKIILYVRKSEKKDATSGIKSTVGGLKSRKGLFIAGILIGLTCSVLLFRVSIFWGVVLMISVPLIVSALLGIIMVEEGKAKVVLRLGGFKKVIMTWKDHVLDDQWNVVGGVGSKSGLHWIGFWPISRVFHYNFRYCDVQLIQGQEKVESHNLEDIDYIFVKPDIYWTNIKAAETSPPERIPVDVEFLVTVQVVNPYKALFVGPSNWNENAMARLNAMLRNWVSGKTIDTLLQLKRNRTSNSQLWEEVGRDPLINWIKGKWGIEVLKNGIEIRDFNLPKEYQEAAAAEQKMIFQTKAVAARTIGAVVESMAKARGKKPEEIQVEINQSPELQKEFLATAKDLIHRQMAIDGKSFIDIRTPDAKGGAEATLLALLTAWQRMPGGSQGTSGDHPPENPRIEELRKIAKEGLPLKK